MASKQPAKKSAKAASGAPAKRATTRPPSRPKRPRPRGPALRAHAALLLDRLLERYPDAHCALDFTNAFELLCATILSAQCTDKRVNMVTPALFARYPDARALAAARQEDVEELIKSTGFFRNKAKSLIGMATAIVERHGGEVPADMDALVVLPGVGRKTANVILGNAFGVPGLTVDTHFQRLVHRFEWTEETDPVKIESAVGKLIEKRDWTMFSHRIIFHGRRVCHARKPACGACLLAKDCPAYGTGPTGFEAAAKLVKGPRAAEIVAQATPA